MATERLSASELRTWQALLHAYHDVVRTLDREMQDEHDLTLAEYDVLLRLTSAPDKALRMSDLAQRVLMSPSGITRLVDRLTKRGFVERQEDPDDGRVAMAHLTQAGVQHLRTAAKTHLRGIREHFTGRLTETQLRQIADGLEMITGAHQPH
jgi:DNA-binding MarR family transcriptional regulator